MGTSKETRHSTQGVEEQFFKHKKKRYKVRAHKTFDQNGLQFPGISVYVFGRRIISGVFFKSFYFKDAYKLDEVKDEAIKGAIESKIF